MDCSVAKNNVWRDAVLAPNNTTFVLSEHMWYDLSKNVLQSFSVIFVLCNCMRRSLSQVVYNFVPIIGQNFVTFEKAQRAVVKDFLAWKMSLHSTILISYSRWKLNVSVSSSVTILWRLLQVVQLCSPPTRLHFNPWVCLNYSSSFCRRASSLF